MKCTAHSSFLSLFILLPWNLVVKVVARSSIYLSHPQRAALTCLTHREFGRDLQDLAWAQRNPGGGATRSSRRTRGDGSSRFELHGSEGHPQLVYPFSLPCFGPGRGIPVFLSSFAHSQNFPSLEEVPEQPPCCRRKPPRQYHKLNLIHPPAITITPFPSFHPFSSPCSVTTEAANAYLPTDRLEELTRGLQGPPGPPGRGRLGRPGPPGKPGEQGTHPQQPCPKYLN